MARDEHDREDIMREATALVERVELNLPGYAEPVVAGFRRNGSASFFIGGNLVIQFNSRGELRRAYDAGRLLKAQHGSLVAMERVRGASAVELRSRPLAAAEQESLLQRLAAHLAAIAAALATHSGHAARQIPPDGDVPGRVEQWLAKCPRPIAVASAPHAT
jgi:hypothetical protein